MILRSECVTQAIDEDHVMRFVKELVHVAGPQPLAMVRKRLPDSPVSREAAPTHAGMPLLLMHGFGQNRYAWHLSRRSFVNFLASRGFDVFNLDLRGHGRSRTLGALRTPSIDEYIQEDVPAAVREICELTGRPSVVVVGHSLGSLVGSAAAALPGSRIGGLVMIGSPYRFGRGSAVLRAFSHAVERLGASAIVRGPHGGVPVRAIGRVLGAQRWLFDTKWLPIPVRAWHPGEFAKRELDEYLARSFDAASVGTVLQLARIALRGEFRSADDRIDYNAAFEALDLPLLVIAGARDLLAPPESVRPAYDRSRSSDKTYRVFDLGHGDLLLGKSAVHTVWPLVAGWLEQHAARVAVDGASARTVEN